MKKTFFWFLLCLTAAAVRPSETLAPGASIPAFSAKDQHGVAYEYKPGPRFLLVAFDMSTGKEANKVLEKKGPEYLTEKKAVYISNIHGMPAIGRAFALPKMKKYPHRIILADNEKLLEPFPKQKDRVTILALATSGEIERISFWNPEKETIDETLK